MLEIYYHASNIPNALYNNRKPEEEAFIDKIKTNKALNSIHVIQNTSQNKTPYRHEDRSGVYLKKLNFSPISDISEIDAASYLYCGLTHLLPKNNVGIALDKKGDLLIIKGKSSNLFKGIYKKYTSGYRYQSACLTEGISDIKFNHLYINQFGLLIGETQLTHQHYHITIKDILSPLDAQEQTVNLCLNLYEKKSFDEKLTLQKRDLTNLSFYYQNGQLFINSIETANKKIDYSIMEYDIKIPLKKHYLIKSIKKVKNNLQIETQKGMKNRIFYLSPDHISIKKLTARKISHKPPQHLTSRLGSDPHEKYHAGQPFTSDRKGNFSSLHIPLFSSIIDKFRVHLQSAKENLSQGKKRPALNDLAKSVDPGINALYTLAVDRINPIRQQPASHCTESKLSTLAGLPSQASALIPTLHRPLGNTLPLNSGEAIISMANKLKVGESISLQNSNRVSGFFGVAAGGIPFNPGWFAGLVVILAKSYNMTLSRIDNNHISATFSYRRKNSAIAILGTGQGLEKTLLTTHTMDYMTVMPAEANLILVTHCTKGCDFSFTLSVAHFERFATQLYCPESRYHFEQLLITTPSTLKNIKEKEWLIMLEAKSELRAQIGALVNPVTYMVMPRTALGARLALNLLEVKSASEKIINPDHTQTKKNNLTVSLLSPEADLFHEVKIMPIAMQQGAELWCYPLPLIEEYRPTHSFFGKKKFTLSRDKQKGYNKQADKQSEYLDTHYDRCFHLSEIEKIPLTIQINQSLSIDKYRIQDCHSNNKQITSLVKKLNHIKSLFLQQQRESLHKKCQVNLFCYYSHHDVNDEIQKYQLNKIEIRRTATFNHFTATIPLAILSLENNKSISYDELLGEIYFKYHALMDNTPSDIDVNLNFIY